MTPSERERAAEALRQEIYALWKRLKPDFGQASSQAIIRGWIMDFEEAARREERKRCAEIADSIAMSNYGNASLASAKIASVIRALDKETA